MPETAERKKKRTLKIIGKLTGEYPDARCRLNYENPFQLLISTILAAQSTDAGINKLTGELYKKYRTPEDFASADPAVLEKEMNSINFYRNKTKSVIKCSKALVEKFGGKVPQTMEELTSLAGVGRKTANVVLGNCFGLPAIMTDTHLIRVTLRLGLADSEVPDKLEAELRRIVPEDKQTRFSHIIGEHGRQVCKARKPLCAECVLSELCPGAFKV